MTAARAINKKVFVFINFGCIQFRLPLFVRRRINSDNSRAQNSVERAKATVSGSGHTAGVKGKIRRAGRNPAHKVARCSPLSAKKRKRKISVFLHRAKSRPAQRAQGSRVELGRERGLEPPGPAANAAKQARRNKPCRNGSRRVRRARHQPPVLARGRPASTPATGCKQWPTSFSRLEFHPPAVGKLNRF